MAEINWEEFGKLINSKRKEKDISQSTLAKDIGVSQPVISLLERGSPIGINEERIDLLKSKLDISDSEIPQKEKVKVSTKRKRAFISYSHKDKTYFDRLAVHLKPLEKKGLIEAWSDTRISAGELWKTEISKALDQAQVAVLLISADFLASDFIVDNELPPLLEKAKSDGATIIPVILKPCRFVREETLAKFQAINSPEEPLIAASEHESESHIRCSSRAN
ncbi:TIR domain-containing protein [Marinomonas sp. RS-M-Aa-14]|uniref:TIR domain-containing protein n=1 Tax=Marinomonas sp. RS-M-Aa-14 TaxID=3241169 RepID=UPI003AAEF0EA